MSKEISIHTQPGSNKLIPTTLKSSFLLAFLPIIYALFAIFGCRVQAPLQKHGHMHGLSMHVLTNNAEQHVTKPNDKYLNNIYATQKASLHGPKSLHCTAMYDKQHDQNTSDPS